MTSRLGDKARKYFLNEIKSGINKTVDVKKGLCTDTFGIPALTEWNLELWPSTATVGRYK